MFHAKHCICPILEVPLTVGTLFFMINEEWFDPSDMSLQTAPACSEQRTVVESCRSLRSFIDAIYYSIQICCTVGFSELSSPVELTPLLNCSAHIMKEADSMPNLG